MILINIDTYYKQNIIIFRYSSSCSSDYESDESQQPRKYREQNRKSPNVAHWLWAKLNNSNYAKILQWTNGPQNGEFKILDQKGLAKLWGERKFKNNGKMTYTNFA